MRRSPSPSARSDDHDGRPSGAPEAPSPGGPRSVASRLRPALAVGAAGAVYFVLACLAYWPASPLDTTRLAGCACGDPEQQTWFLAWTSYAVTHGHNPFFTSYLHAPMGANLAIDTAMPLLGFLGIPVTLLAGPVATFNLLLRIGIAASGASMFGVLRRYVSWWPAAFGGGLMFAFSPYVANQAVRHIFLSFVPLVPLFIPILDDWLISRRRSPVRSGILLGLVAALQYLISAEVLLTSAIMAVVGLAYLALRYRAAVAERVGVLVRGVAAAIPVFLLIAGYAIWMLLAGPARPVGALHTLSGLARYHGDLLSPLYPTGRQFFAPAGMAAIGNRLPKGASIEDGFYLGFPLLVLLGYLIIRCRRVPLVATAAVVGVGAFILGLGPRLTLDSHSLGVPLPFALFRYLPVVQNLEAARFSLYIQLAAAIVFGVGLDRVRTFGWLPAAAPDRGDSSAAEPGSGDTPAAEPDKGDAPRPRAPGWVSSAVVAAVGLAAILPIMPNLPIETAPVNTPKFFTSTDVQKIPSGALTFTLPYDIAPQNDAMMWQAASGMRFRLIGGDAFVPGAGGRSTWHPEPAGPKVLLKVLSSGQYRSTSPPPMTRHAIAAVRQLLAREHVSVVLVGPTAREGYALAALMKRALGPPTLHRGQMEVWLNVQRALQRQPG